MKIVFYICYFYGAINFIKWVSMFARYGSTIIGKIAYRFCEVFATVIDFRTAGCLCIVALLVILYLAIAKHISWLASILPILLNLVSAILYWLMLYA